MIGRRPSFAGHRRLWPLCSHCQLAIAGHIAPICPGLPVLDGIGPFIEGHSRADMIRYPIEDISDLKIAAWAVFAIQFDHQMFLALSDCRQARSVEQANPLGDLILGGNGLMAQIEAESGLAPEGDHPGDDQGSRGKWLIGELVPISLVPIDERSRAALDLGGPAGVDGEGG